MFLLRSSDLPFAAFPQEALRRLGGHLCSFLLLQHRAALVVANALIRLCPNGLTVGGGVARVAKGLTAQVVDDSIRQQAERVLPLVDPRVLHGLTCAVLGQPHQALGHLGSQIDWHL